MNFFRYTAKHLIMTILSLLFSLLIVAGCTYFYMIFQLEDVEALKDMRLQTPLRIYSSDGQLIGEYGSMRRNPITLAQVPKPLLAAIIATEDQRFFEHNGVDLIGIVRATRELLITGQRNQGASTITMQVARNFFLTREKTFSRKINEILLALKINSTLSKEKILELYLNKIYLGQRAYGVSAAAEIYYGKRLDQLNLSEMAMIAGLPQSPSKENPITNPSAAKERRNHVLARMLELGYIDQKAYAEASSAPAATYYHGPKITLYAPHVAEMVRNVIYQQYGEDGYTSGLQVYTTLNSGLQQAANLALQHGLIAYERRHSGYRGPEKNLGRAPRTEWQDILASLPAQMDLIPAAIIQLGKNSARGMLANGATIPIALPQRGFKIGDVVRVIQKEEQWELAQLPKIEGALVALNPDTGAILALNGGFDNANNGFNRAVQAYRQPGSSFKPFIYAAALAKGYNLATIVNDEPIAINDTGDPNNLWQPQNSDNQFHGPTRLRVGLVRSINVMTVRLLQMLGVPYAINYITQFGFSRDSLPPSLSLALGTALETPLQMASAYAVFANGGYRVIPYFIERIESADEKLLYQAKPTAPFLTINPEIAYLITNVLQDVVQHGTAAAAAAKLGRGDLAGKTGTTNRQIDAWFSGYNRRLVATVWVGYNQPKPLYEYGAQAALPIWVDFMKEALEGKPEESLPPPSNIVTVRINRETGLLADPEDADSFFEVFVANNVPQEEQTEAEDAEAPVVVNDGMIPWPWRH